MKDISEAKDPDMRASMEALQPASLLARQTAIQTDTHLVIVKDGRLLDSLGDYPCQEAFLELQSQLNHSPERQETAQASHEGFRAAHISNQTTQSPDSTESQPANLTTLAVPPAIGSSHRLGCDSARFGQ